MTPSDIKASEKKIRKRMAQYKNHEYISVKGFAEAVGISDRYIYEQMEGKLSVFVVMVGDTKMIRPEAVEGLFWDDEETDKQTDIKEAKNV